MMALRRREGAMEPATTSSPSTRRSRSSPSWASCSKTYGPRVFARIAALRPDAVVLDLAPDENAGWGLLARLRAGEATRGIPVLVVSTDAGLLERAREQEPGVSARRYLAKPMALADVLDAVAELVGRR
jgi:CheY-like chemotaxis protein